MNVIEGIIIGASLALDALAVSICKGLEINKFNLKSIIKIGIYFSIFQMLMPTLGFLLGSSFENLIRSIDHYIAFILLFILGIKMIKEKEDNIKEGLSFKIMIYLSIATSIDAFAVGIAYVCAYGSIFVIRTILIIGIITFILSSIGVIIGIRFGSCFKGYTNILGGAVLILIGVKILLSHLGLL